MLLAKSENTDLRNKIRDEIFSNNNIYEFDQMLERERDKNLEVLRWRCELRLYLLEVAEARKGLGRAGNVGKLCSNVCTYMQFSCSGSWRIISGYFYRARYVTNTLILK